MGSLFLLLKIIFCYKHNYVLKNLKKEMLMSFVKVCLSIIINFAHVYKYLTQCLAEHSIKIRMPAKGERDKKKLGSRLWASWCFTGINNAREAPGSPQH